MEPLSRRMLKSGVKAGSPARQPRWGARAAALQKKTLQYVCSFVFRV